MFTSAAQENGVEFLQWPLFRNDRLLECYVHPPCFELHNGITFFFWGGGGQKDKIYRREGADACRHVRKSDQIREEVKEESRKLKDKYSAETGNSNIS